MSVRYPLLLLFVIVAASALSPTGNALAQGRERGGTPGPSPLLGAVEIASNNLAALPQWTRILNKIEDEKKAMERCDVSVDACTSAEIVAWRAMIQGLRSQAPLDQLSEVNRFLNTWSEKPDDENYGAEEYWASPLEFIARSGDSEDFAIVKFFTLRELGFTNEQLRIVVAKDVLRNKVHSFLAVYHEGEIHILDSVSNSVLTQNDVKYYVPFYSVNETTRWAHIVVHAQATVAAGKTAGGGR
ncbi:MAG: transglutaminase-like cysteine peptidase [Alphaproteobacteria bacterium]|nr:transglutaminase-like cysteine peptidase [Alphaproteobacteria bacterium]